MEYSIQGVTEPGSLTGKAQSGHVSHPASVDRIVRSRLLFTAAATAAFLSGALMVWLLQYNTLNTHTHFMMAFYVH